mgnify:CR=1 FL=1
MDGQQFERRHAKRPQVVDDNVLGDAGVGAARDLLVGARHAVDARDVGSYGARVDTPTGQPTFSRRTVAIGKLLPVGNW